APADHFNATGVGADVAADLTGTCRREIHRVEQPLLFSVGLQLFGNHTSAALNGTVNGVKFRNLVHVIKGDHHFTIGGHGTGTQAGTTTGRHQLQAALISQQHNVTHLFGGFREHNGARLRLVHLGPVFAE